MAGEKEILLASGNLGKWRYSLFFYFFLFACLLVTSFEVENLAAICCLFPLRRGF